MASSMRRVLFVTASARGLEHSTSRKAAERLKMALMASNQHVKITELDVGRNPPKPLDEEYAIKLFQPGTHSRLLDSENYVDQLKQQDAVVIATSMYNWTLPSSLKLYIDHVVRLGKTFDWNGGLLDGTKCHIILASGAVKAGSEKDFCTPYLKMIMNLMGTDMTYDSTDSPAVSSFDGMSMNQKFGDAKDPVASYLDSYDFKPIADALLEDAK